MARESSSALPSFMVLLLFVLCLLTAAAVLHMIKQEEQHQARFVTDKAQAISRQMLEAQQALFVNIRNALRELAVDELLRPPASDACSRYLGERLQASGTFINLWVSGPEGNRRCSALPLIEPVNVADRGYFQQSLKKRELVIGEFKSDHGSKVSSVDVAFPIISASTDRVEGVAVAVISLPWWSERLAEFRLPEGAVALIADGDGRILAHYPRDDEQLGADRARYGLTAKGAAVLASVTELAAGDDGVVRAFAHEELHLSAGGAMLTLSVGIPAASPEGGASRWLRFVSLLFSGLVLVILLLAWQTWWKSPRRSPPGPANGGLHDA